MHFCTGIIFFTPLCWKIFYLYIILRSNHKICDVRKIWYLDPKVNFQNWKIVTYFLNNFSANQKFCNIRMFSKNIDEIVLSWEIEFGWVEVEKLTDLHQFFNFASKNHVFFCIFLDLFLTIIYVLCLIYLEK